MCQQKKLKFVAVVMAMSVLFTPLLSILEIKQTVNVVHAEEATVSAAFFGAVLAMMGITAFMQGNMSSTFSIPETDLLALKDQFAQTLEADAAKKSAWMQAQTDYLAGGVAKTMGAVELAKIGLYDIYKQFDTYLHNIYNLKSNDITNKPSILNDQYTKYKFSYKGYEVYEYDFNNRGILENINSSKTFIKSGIYYNSGNVSYLVSSAHVYLYDPILNKLIYGDNSIFSVYVNYNQNQPYSLSNVIGTQIQIQINNSYTQNQKQIANDVVNMYLRKANLVHQYDATVSINDFIGYVNYNTENKITNETDTAIQIIPTIPWIDNTVPVGTIVTPAIAAPYSGTVPIDVPITAPIDPPIEEPETPSYPDLLSATLAILAALTPISAILDNIDLGIGDLDDVIDAGNTAIADGIDDIINSITGSVTDIGTIVEPITSTLDKIFDPPSKDIDWDKLKNIEIFNKFPFSIPADLYFLMSMLASDPVAPNINIDLDLSFIGAGVQRYTYDLSQFDNFAQVLRSFELLAFVFFLLYSTKNLIWK